MKVVAALVVLFLNSSSGSRVGLPPSLDLYRLQSGEPGCDEDLRSLREGLDTGQLWAQTMVDAGVKSPVGLLSQTAVQFGDFDECIGLQGPVTPQYCLFDLSPAHPANTSWSSFKWSFCAPASCSPQGLRTTLQNYMDQQTEGQGQEVQVGIIPGACTSLVTLSSSFDLVDYIYCSVLMLVLLLVCFATAREMLQRPDYDGVSPPKSIGQCLSARHGFYSLFRRDQPIKGINLSALDGIHSCAIFFVVLGHRYGAHVYFMQLTNYRDVEHAFTDFWPSIWMGHMDLFVDTFFFMSAFLLGAIYYGELHRRFTNPLLVYVFRICRILPAYAVVVFFYATLLRHLGTGPLWNMFMSREQDNCRSYWWTNFLFINTYVKAENMCMLQSWYMSCDFQLFVVGTLLIFFLHKRPRPAVLVFVFVFIASTVAPFLGTYHYKRPAILLFLKDFWADPRKHDLFKSVYSQGHYRGTSYIVGLLAGCYVYRNRNDKLSKTRTYTLQIVGVVFGLLVYWSGALFYDTTHPQPPLVSALYASTFHTAFGLALASIIVSFTLGQETFLSRVFSWKGFIPLSKLSYCVYLIHNIFHFVWAASSRTTVYIGPLELVSWSIADVVLSLIASVFLSLTVETPVRYLIKFLIYGPPDSPLLPDHVETQEKYVIQDTIDLKRTTTK